MCYLFNYFIETAYFDPIHGNRLLTTAQNSQLRLYDSHSWDTPTLIMSHPHRPFQHMTHIKVLITYYHTESNIDTVSVTYHYSYKRSLLIALLLYCIYIYNRLPGILSMRIYV